MGQMAKKEVGKDDIKVSTSNVKEVENEKTKKQEEEAKEIAARKKEAEKEAKKAREEEERAAEEARKQAELAREEAERKEAERKKQEAEEEEKIRATTESVAGAGAAILGAAAKSGKKALVNFIKGAVVGLIAGALITYLIGRALSAAPKEPEMTQAEELDETVMSNTTFSFEDAVLGEASEHQELIVMEQPVSLTTTIEKAGLGNLAVFQKTKTVTYEGTGVYTVDLKGLSAESVSVDEEKREVTIKVPHATLQYVTPDYDKVTFADTEKGLLAFGDLKLTLEQQNRIEKAVEDAMRGYLGSDEVLAEADKFAEMKCWDTFQPVITAVSPAFTLTIVFE